MPSIVQLKGPGNTDATLEIWHAAFSWLGKVRDNAVRANACASSGVTQAVSAHKLQSLLAPYFGAVSFSHSRQIVFGAIEGLMFGMGLMSGIEILSRSRK